MHYGNTAWGREEKRRRGGRRKRKRKKKVRRHACGIENLEVCVYILADSNPITSTVNQSALKDF